MMSFILLSMGFGSATMFSLWGTETYRNHRSRVSRNRRVSRMKKSGFNFTNNGFDF
jgi:hypothetical protein